MTVIRWNNVWIPQRSYKGSSLSRKTSGYKPRDHQRGFRKRLISENDKTGPEEENFSLHCVQDSQKDHCFTVECRNGSEASRKEHPFVEWPEESWDSCSHFIYEKTFTADPVFDKQNNLIVMFGNDVSEHRRVSIPNIQPQLWCLASWHQAGRRSLWFGWNGVPG